VPYCEFRTVLTLVRLENNCDMDTCRESMECQDNFQNHDELANIALAFQLQDAFKKDRLINFFENLCDSTYTISIIITIIIPLSNMSCGIASILLQSLCYGAMLQGVQASLVLRKEH